MRYVQTRVTVGAPMIIKSSSQASRNHLFKRFPIPENFSVTKDSKIGIGKRWPAPAGAKRTKAFEIYRYDPDSGCGPRLEIFEVDLALGAAGILAT